MQVAVPPIRPSKRRTPQSARPAFRRRRERCGGAAEEKRERRGGSFRPPGAGGCEAPSESQPCCRDAPSVTLRAAHRGSGAADSHAEAADAGGCAARARTGRAGRARGLVRQRLEPDPVYTVTHEVMIRPLKIDPVQFGAKVGRHMLEFGRNPVSAADRMWLENYVRGIYANATEFRDGTFSGQGAVLPAGSNARGPVWFFAKGRDVVVTDRADNFVTILKDGINNTSFRTAKILLVRP